MLSLELLHQVTGRVCDQDTHWMTRIIIPLISIRQRANIILASGVNDTSLTSMPYGREPWAWKTQAIYQ